MRRSSPLGIHTHAIVRLLQLRRNEYTLGPQSLLLMRAAAPRIQARQLLCDSPDLSGDIRSFAMSAEHQLSVHVAKFVADACDIMHVVKVHQKNLAKGLANPQPLAELSHKLFKLLSETQLWFEQDSTPRPRSVALHSQQDVYWSLPTARATILVSDHTWVARDWVLFHMCCIKISDILLDISMDYLRQTIDEDIQSHLATLIASSRFLLDMMPFVMGIANENGAISAPVLCDIGLLIAHYPLLVLTRSKHLPSDAKLEASTLLTFIEAQRNIVTKTS